jgi:Anti-sigma factor NepR
MSKPDGATSARGSLGSDSGGSESGPVAAALTVAKPPDQSPRPSPRAAASADGPEPAVRERAGPHSRLDADLQAVIGQQLRAVYHEILNEPVPDRFVQLLEQLATKAADRR